MPKQASHAVQGFQEVPNLFDMLLPPNFQVVEGDAHNSA